MVLCCAYLCQCCTRTAAQLHKSCANAAPRCAPPDRGSPPSTPQLHADQSLLLCPAAVPVLRPHLPPQIAATRFNYPPELVGMLSNQAAWSVEQVKGELSEMISNARQA